jgi:hypothetical protein
MKAIVEEAKRVVKYIDSFKPQIQAAYDLCRERDD